MQMPCLLVPGPAAFNKNSRNSISNKVSEVRGHLSKPDVLRIRLLYVEGTGKDQVHICAVRAEQHAIEAAKVYGWQSWLKIEFEEQTVTYLSHSDPLIR